MSAESNQQISQPCYLEYFLADFNRTKHGPSPLPKIPSTNHLLCLRLVGIKLTKYDLFHFLVYIKK